MLTSENLTDFCALVEVIAGKRDADYVREQSSRLVHFIAIGMVGKTILFIEFFRKNSSIDKDFS